MSSHQEKFEKVLRKLIEFLEKELAPERVILFGSRAKNKAHPYSDIDLAIFATKPLDLRGKRKLKEEVEELSYPFKVDLVFMDEVSEEFKRVIYETGRVVYEKDRASACSGEVEKVL